MDNGRRRTNASGSAGNPAPPNGRAVHSTIHSVASGAQVFAAGTMQWSWGLAPHALGSTQDGTTYAGPAIGSSVDLRIQQVTTNLLYDMGVMPETPHAGIRVGPYEPPRSDPDPTPTTPSETPPTTTQPETPTPPPPARDTTAPRVSFPGSRTIRLTRDGRLRVPIQLAGAEPGSASGTFDFTTAKAFRPRRGARPRKIRFGRGRFSVAPGRRTTLSVRVGDAERRLVRERGHVDVVVRVVARDAAKNTRTVTATLRVLPAKALQPKA